MSLKMPFEAVEWNDALSFDSTHQNINEHRAPEIEIAEAIS